MAADLITLSACETALGSGYFAEVPAGDDLVGLTRAFLFAGEVGARLHNPHILPEDTDPYSVEDTAFREFKLKLSKIKDRQLREGNKATALATAQRQMLHGGGRYAHPYFWAPFTLVGAMR